jgi:sucrose-6-phosphate hydrolase SacC (GH32 family)
VEVFAQDGQVTMTELIFPAATSAGVAVYANGGTATINRLNISQYA